MRSESRIYDYSKILSNKTGTINIVIVCVIYILADKYHLALGHGQFYDT